MLGWHRISKRLPLTIAWFGIALAAAVGPAQAQPTRPATSNELLIAGPADCANVGKVLRARTVLGSQWLIGENVPLYKRPDPRFLSSTVPVAFEKVQCYGQSSDRDQNNRSSFVFVANKDFTVCGWAQRARLLAENARAYNVLNDETSSLACPAPQAMEFATLCDRMKAIHGQLESEVYQRNCGQAPKGLRAKAVLTGATQGSANEVKYPFFRRAGGQSGEDRRDSKPFFSLLEIFGAERGPEPADTRLLVGDGDGNMFGWISIEALRLWPTRLALYFDHEARGVVFSKRGDMIQNWRTGRPDPNVTAGSTDKVQQHIDGRLPLLSYPIVNTIQQPEIQGDPAYNEVVFLGSADANAGEQLTRQANISNSISDVQKLNILFAIDTTESMTPYLAKITEGIANFIQDYQKTVATNQQQLPSARIGVIAYSDFASTAQISQNGKIVTAELLPPTAIDRSFQKEELDPIARHPGLADSAGGFAEAGFELIGQLVSSFANSSGWLEDGPRVIIHIADHGSRPDANIDRINGLLAANNILYYPIVVETDDQGNPSRAEARATLERQAVRLFQSSRPDISAKTLPRIDFRTAEQVTSVEVQKSLLVAIAEVQQALSETRRDLVGDTLADTAAQAISSASAEIKFDERLRRQYGLDQIGERSIAVADTGYAPLQLKTANGTEAIAWTYTVAFDDAQVHLFQQKFRDLCALIGRPEKGQQFLRTVVDLASAFSGENVANQEDMRAVLGELSVLPGTAGSFLAEKPALLIAKARSKDTAVVSELKQDLCWTSFFLDLVVSGYYLKRNDVVWNGASFGVKSDSQLRKRNYRYQSIVGSAVYYLPSWFFAKPPTREQNPQECGFFCK